MCVALRTHSLLQELKEWFVEQQNIVGEGGVALREPGHVERSQQLVGPTAEVGGGGGGGGGETVRRSGPTTSIVPGGVQEGKLHGEVPRV